MYYSYGADSFCFSVHHNAVSHFYPLNFLMHEENLKKASGKLFVARSDTTTFNLYFSKFT